MKLSLIVAQTVFEKWKVDLEKGLIKKRINCNPGPCIMSQKLKDYLTAAMNDAGALLPGNQLVGFGAFESSHRDNLRVLKYTGFGFERDILDRLIKNLYNVFNVSKEDFATIVLPAGATQMFDAVTANFAAEDISKYDLMLGMVEKIKEELSTDKVNIPETGDKIKIGIIDTGDFSKRFLKSVKQKLKLYNVEFFIAKEPDASDLVGKVDHLLVTLNATVEGQRFNLSKLSSYFNEKVWLDMTSGMLTEEIDWTKIKVAFGSTTKILGLPGATIVIVRRSSVESTTVLPGTTDVYNFAKQIKVKGLLNTPPVVNILAALHETQVIIDKGGISALNSESRKKSGLIYNVIAASNGFYNANIKIDEDKSLVNVVFSMKSEELWNDFLDEAESFWITGTKGHKIKPQSTRNSGYTWSFPYEWTEVIVGFMIDFAQRNGIEFN